MAHVGADPLTGSPRPWRAALAARLRAWIFQPRGAETGEVLLVQRRVFILPTRYGFFFALSLLAFLAASINYELALGFVLTFFLASAGLVTMLHTFRNQVHMVLAPLRTVPAFAGGEAVFEVLLANRRATERPSIWLITPADRVAVDVPPAQGATVRLRAPAPRRGLLPAPRITLETRYPLGLFRAWSYWQPAMSALVYPRPLAGHLDPPPGIEGAGEGAPRGEGSDDFIGLRDYRASDSPRLIAWRSAAVALASGAPLPAKSFAARTSGEFMFDLEQLHGDLETRLSLLTSLVLEADTAGARYALRGGGATIGPDSGPAHRERCLAHLALMPPLPAG